MAESGDDKTEAPTPKRRQEAREKGTIPRSGDLSAAVLMIGGLLILKFFGGGVYSACASMMTEMLGRAAFTDTAIADGQLLLLRSSAAAASALAPLLVGLVLLAITVNLAQTGFLFDMSKVSFNFAALNPVGGFSRVFGGGQGLAKLAMNVMKLGLVGMAAYSAIAGRLGEIIGVQRLDFGQVFTLAGQTIFAISIRVAILLCVLAIVDYLYQRFRIEKQLRMTKQEIKDEMKNQDGNPLLKARRRQIAIAQVKERLKHDVPKADVVVTNPTEFAVALQYDPDQMTAPKVVAKGQGFVAARIREIAIQNGIPILERKPLARALYKVCAVGQTIPEDFFSAVAEILAYVYELNGRFRQKHAA